MIPPAQMAKPQNGVNWRTWLAIVPGVSMVFLMNYFQKSVAAIVRYADGSGSAFPVPFSTLGNDVRRGNPLVSGGEARSMAKAHGKTAERLRGGMGVAVE